MRLAVFEGDVCASIEKDLAAHNIQAERRFPAMMRFSRGKETDRERQCFCSLYVSTRSHEERGCRAGCGHRCVKIMRGDWRNVMGTQRGGR